MNAQYPSPVALICEDEPPIIESLEYVARKAGLTPVVAENGIEAYEQACTLKPALMLVDMGLPGISGDVLCRKLKENPLTREVPVIMVTANTQIFHKELAAQAGVDRYVSKPFSPRELISLCREYLVEDYANAKEA